MKKIISIIAALTVCCTVLTACGSDSDGSGKTNKSSSELTLTKGDDGNAMPSAEKVYKAKDGEHRFLDILEQIEKEQKITIIQDIPDSLAFTYDKAVTFAYDVNAGKFIHITGQVFGNWAEYDHGRSTVLWADELLEKTEDGEYFKGTFVDLEQKTKTRRPVNDWSNDDGSQIIWEHRAYESKNIPDIPVNLAPDKWSYNSSDKVSINGLEYYCENYTVDMTLDDSNEEASINVIFDSTGDVVFMGSAVPYVPEDGDEIYIDYIDYVDMCIPIAKLFYNPNQADILDYISHFCATAYDQYTEISIKPEFDSSYALDSFRLIEDVDEFANAQFSDKKQSIYEELGLD